MKAEVLGVKAPERKKAEVHDKNCPFYGSMNVKKETFTGTVVKRDAHGTATIEWFRPIFVPKYERNEIRRSRIRAHNPTCISAEVGQKVLVARTRPISKSKHHVIIKVLGTEKVVKSEDVTLKKKEGKKKVVEEVKEETEPVKFEQEEVQEETQEVLQEPETNEEELTEEGKEK